MNDFVPVPFGALVLRLPRDVFETALAEAQGIAAPAQAALAPEPLMDSRQLAALLNVGDTLLEQMAKDGRIPSIRVGDKHLRFEPHAVIAALKARHADKQTLTGTNTQSFPARKGVATKKQPGLHARDEAQI